MKLKKLPLHHAADPEICAEVDTYLTSWASRSEEADIRRRIHNGTLSDIFQSGLFDKLALEYSASNYNIWPSMVEASRITANACASTAWIMGVVGGHHAIITRLPEAKHTQIYGGNPQQLFASASPTLDCSMTWASDGVWIKGRWSFSSGIEDATWLLVNADCQGHPQGDANQKFLIALQTSKLKILSVWDSLGMRGTGSHDVLVENVLIPHDEVYSVDKLFSARTGTPMNDYISVVNLYPYLTSSIIGPIFGCAEGAFEYYLSLLNQQGACFNSEFIVTLIAEFNSLGLLYGSLLAHLDNAGVQGMPWSSSELSKLRRDRSFLAQSCSRFVYKIIASLNASSFSMQHPLQRAWRDLQTMVSHRDVSWVAAVKSQSLA